MKLSQVPTNQKNLPNKMSDENTTIQDEIIELNVAGKHFTTMKSTLLKVPGSKFESFFEKDAQVVKDKEGAIFIDYPPVFFEDILNSLRTGKELHIPDDDEKFKALCREIKYYGLESHFKKQLEGGSFVGGNLLNSKQKAILHGWIKLRGRNYQLLYK